MYVIAPAINGLPDVGSARIISAYSEDGKIAYCNLDTEAMQPGWAEITDPEIIKRLTPTQPAPEPTTEEINLALLLDLYAKLEEKGVI